MKNLSKTHNREITAEAKEKMYKDLLTEIEETCRLYNLQANLLVFG